MENETNGLRLEPEGCVWYSEMRNKNKESISIIISHEIESII